MGSNIWWLSFVDEGKHLGCTIVEAEGMVKACKAAHRLGVNPGGEVMGIEMPDTVTARAEVEALGMNRLIPAKELKEKGYITERERENPN